MTWEQLSRLGRELPEVVEGTWFRTPALKVRGKSFVRLKERQVGRLSAGERRRAGDPDQSAAEPVLHHRSLRRLAGGAGEADEFARPRMSPAARARLAPQGSPHAGAAIR